MRTSGTGAPRMPEKLTVLLVEDEEQVRNVIRRSLERAGYRVVEATDGETGLKLAQEHGRVLGAVVTDMMMPGMGGRAFAESLALTHPHAAIATSVRGRSRSESGNARC